MLSTELNYVYKIYYYNRTGPRCRRETVRNGRWSRRDREKRQRTFEITARERNDKRHNDVKSKKKKKTILTRSSETDCAKTI